MKRVRKQVRMDLQLYRIDEGNYLVDFRNLGYRAIPNDSPRLSPRTTQSTFTSDMDLPNTADEIRARKPSATAVWKGKSSRHGDEVSSPYLFLEVAVKLIFELASPSAPAES